MKEDFVEVTATQSLPLIEKWFDKAGDVLMLIPGLQGVGRGYKVVAQGAGGLEFLYQLAHEISQAEALEKGGHEAVKRIKPVARITDALLKKKFPEMPKVVRDKLAQNLEDAFEKFVTDPAIKEGKKKMQEMDEGKHLDRPLSEDIKKWLFPTFEFR